MAKIRNLELADAEHWIIRLVAKDAAGPLDLTDGSGQWCIRGGPIFEGFVQVAEEGEIDFIVTPEDHSALVPGEYFYEMRVMLADGIISSQVRGTLTVVE